MNRDSLGFAVMHSSELARRIVCQLIVLSAFELTAVAKAAEPLKLERTGDAYGSASIIELEVASNGRVLAAVHKRLQTREKYQSALSLWSLDRSGQFSPLAERKWRRAVNGAFVAGSSLIAVAGDDMAIWSPKDDKLHIFRSEDEIFEADESGFMGGRVYVSENRFVVPLGSDIAVFDLQKPANRFELPAEHSIRSIDVRGNTVVVGDNVGNILLYQLERNREPELIRKGPPNATIAGNLPTIEGVAKVRFLNESSLAALVWTPNGEFIEFWSSREVDGAIRWERAKNLSAPQGWRLAGQMALSADGSYVAFNADSLRRRSQGAFLVSSASLNTVATFALAETASQIDAAFYKDTITSLAFVPNGRYVISGHEGGRITAWKLPESKPSDE